MRKIVPIILTTLILSLITIITESKTSSIVLICFLLVGCFYQLYREVKVLNKFIIAYMFNLKIDFFNKYIERPRIFIYLIFGTIMIISTYNYITLSFSSDIFKNIYLTIYLILYVISFFLIDLSWKNEFISKFIPYVQKIVLNANNKSFELNSYTEENLRKIYNNLLNFDFIELIDDSHDTFEDKLFADILLNGKIPENVIFKLNFDNVQTKYFWDLLKQNNMSFTLDDFLKIFCNKNRKATRKTIEPSFSKSSKEPKRKQDIDSCFIF